MKTTQQTTPRTAQRTTQRRWAPSPARCVSLCVAAIAVAAFTGCTSAPIVPPSDAQSPTGGLDLAIWYAKTDTRQYQYFVLSADGVLQYGAGMVAFNRGTDWKGQITADEGKEIRSIIDGANWMTAKDPSLKTEESPVAEITVANGKAERFFTIQGPNEPVVRITQILGGVADKRFDRLMRSLPEAGQRVK